MAEENHSSVDQQNLTSASQQQLPQPDESDHLTSPLHDSYTDCSSNSLLYGTMPPSGGNMLPSGGPTEKLLEPPRILPNPTVSMSDVRVDINGEKSIVKQSTALQKGDLEKYINDPWWVRLRCVLILVISVLWVAMLVTAVIIIVIAPRCSSPPPLDWWQKAVVYQVYTPSFQDSDDDGVGDINGVSNSLSYLKKLGITTIWLTAVFEGQTSATFHLNYNNAIIDHMAIDQRYGTIEDFEKLVDAVHLHDLKIIVDFVPNQTGRKHKWFDENPNFYIWNNGRERTDEGPQPPNNWLSALGGSAWSWSNEPRSGFYYHQFGQDQPDLNLTDETVANQMKTILTFWLGKGVDGFHVNSAELLVESEDVLKDEPRTDGSQSDKYPTAYNSLNHTLTSFQTKSFELMSDWRTVLDEYSLNDGKPKSKFSPRLLVAGLRPGATSKQTTQFSVFDTGRRQGGAHISTNTGLLGIRRGCDALCVHLLVKDWLDQAEETGVWSNWQLDNIETSRSATRMADPDDVEGTGPDYVNALNMLLLTLPGTTFTYYGAELGMRDETELIGHNLNNRARMLWTEKTKLLPVDASSEIGQQREAIRNNYINHHNVKVQQAHGSGLTNIDVFQSLTKLRRSPSFEYGACYPGVEDNIFFHIRQAHGSPGFLVAINFGPSPSTADFIANAPGGKIPSAATVVLTTGRFEGEGRKEEYAIGTSVMLRSVHLRPSEGVIFRWTHDTL